MNEAELNAFKGQLHIDWEGADVIAKMTHIPTGIYIEPNVKDEGQRDKLIEELAAKVGR